MRSVLVLITGIASTHCTDDETFTLLCSPTQAMVGERIDITLEYDIDDEEAPFEFSASGGLGMFDEVSIEPPNSFGSVTNGFTPQATGTTSLVASRDGTAVASCPIEIVAMGTFQVAVQVTGNGTVRFNNVDCPPDCQEQIASGEMVTLVATADNGWTFDGWTGDCASAVSTTATVDVDGDKSCGARFVELTGPGPGEVAVAAGTFRRGCTLPSCPGTEPASDIAMSGFIIDETEVTVAAYRTCVDDGTCTAPASGSDCNYQDATRDQHPVNCVTWQQAKDYCAFVGKDLPTEAQWEMAARGTADERIFPWGDDDADCARVNIIVFLESEMRAETCVGSTTPVGTYPTGASPNGTLDMAGNVSEWVEDWYEPDYYNTGPTMDPPSPPSSPVGSRVHRGGSFGSSFGKGYVFTRDFVAPETARAEIGFRCAR